MTESQPLVHDKDIQLTQTIEGLESEPSSSAEETQLLQGRKS